MDFKGFFRNRSQRQHPKNGDRPFWGQSLGLSRASFHEIFLNLQKFLLFSSRGAVWGAGTPTRELLSQNRSLHFAIRSAESADRSAHLAFGSAQSAFRSADSAHRSAQPAYSLSPQLETLSP
jgi:hypothetical protein